MIRKEKGIETGQEVSFSNQRSGPMTVPPTYYLARAWLPGPDDVQELRQRAHGDDVFSTLPSAR